MHPEQPPWWSEERSTALLEHASDVITLLSTDGTVLYQSPSIRHVLGYAPEEREGTSNFAAPLVHPDDRGSQRRFLADALGHPGETVTAVFRLRHADGSWRTIEALGVNRLDEPAVGGVVATYRDVTEREERRERQRFLLQASALLTESLDYGVTLDRVARLSLPLLADWCAIDLLDEAGEVRRVAVAHADPGKDAALLEMSRRYGPAAAEPSPVLHVLRSGQSLFFPAIGEEQVAALTRDADHARLARVVGLSAGMVVPLRARGRALGTLSLVVGGARRYRPDDLALAEEVARYAALAVDNARLFRAEQAARRRAEQVAARNAALQDITAAFAAAVTAEQVAAVVIEQGRVALGAAAAALALIGSESPDLELVATSGYSAEQLAGWRRIPLTAPVPLAHAARSGTAAYYDSRAAAVAEYPHLAGDSRAGYEAFVAVPVRVAGRSLGAIGLSFAEARHFAAEDRAFIATLADQCAQALERARLYAVETRARREAEDLARQRQDFVSVASHELKTPLSILQGYLELLERQLARPAPRAEQVARYLAALRQGARRLAALVNDLLDASRFHQGRLLLRPEECDLAEIARAVLARAGESAERTARHTLALDAPASIGGIWDRDRLDQVLTNLVSNALKYSPNGGMVRVRVARVADTAVEVAVSDEGIGIAPEEQGQLFQPFVRVQAARHAAEGTGLGLFIVREIVAAHGGTLALASAPGTGTTVTLRLPLVAAPPGAGE